MDNPVDLAVAVGKAAVAADTAVVAGMHCVRSADHLADSLAFPEGTHHSAPDRNCSLVRSSHDSVAEPVVAVDCVAGPAPRRASMGVAHRRWDTEACSGYAAAAVQRVPVVWVPAGAALAVRHLHRAGSTPPLTSDRVLALANLDVSPAVVAGAMKCRCVNSCGERAAGKEGVRQEGRRDKSMVLSRLAEYCEVAR
jgi:hypothetical protein